MKRQTQALERLSMYDTPPSSEVQLEEFESCAIERQTLLRALDDVTTRRLSSDQTRKSFDKLCSQFSLSCKNADEVRRDTMGHFILRLAYCRTEDLRKWFLNTECNLFKFRFEHLLDEKEQLSFVRSNNIDVEQITEQEFKQNEIELTRMCGDASVRTFWKVPFEEVLELVGQRQVMMHRGQAFVPSSQLSVIVVGRFRTMLSRCLVQMHKVMPAIETEEQYGSFLKKIGVTYFGPDFTKETKGHVTISDLDTLAVRSMPLCMSNLHDTLKRSHHLRHGGRLQYGLFLKGIGLTLEDALTFWKSEFTKGSTPADKFDKEYAYTVRYNYGKEGRRTDWSPYSCMKIINSAPAAGAGDAHGCPFRHFNADQLSATMRKKGLSSGASAEVLGLIKNHHYQVACKKYFAHTHGGIEPLDDVGNHPNGYFKASKEYYEGLNKNKAALPEREAGQTQLNTTQVAPKAVKAV